LTVAGASGCDYCASAHTALGKGAGVAVDELRRNLRGRSNDGATQAALTFASKVVEQRGRVSDRDVEELRTANFSEGEIVEIVAHIGVNLFTNYFNHIAGTEIDFPVVNAAAAPQAA
jgi:AhpD family alkylhydroperoxidase